MFVSSVIDEWWKQLHDSYEEQRRRRLQQRRHNNARHGTPEWDEFLQRQQMIWCGATTTTTTTSPPDLFDKCCPRWLASGRQEFDLSTKPIIAPPSTTTTSTTTTTTTTNNNETNVNNNLTPQQQQQQQHYHDECWPCPGSCHKLHPSITLFFDEERIMTVAVISHPLRPFTTVLDRMVIENCAIRKTSLYYELHGYLRENLSRLRHNPKKGFGSHLIIVAMGAMKLSDKIQKQHLEEALRNKKQRKQSSIVPYSFHQLEEVLEIVRLHRLQDDLDVLSIYCMRRVSKSFNRIAIRMANHRMEHAQIIASPLVDGCSLSGFSVFRRTTSSQEEDEDDDENEEEEAGRTAATARRTVIFKTPQKGLIEYAECEHIICDASSSSSSSSSLSSQLQQARDDVEEEEEESLSSSFLSALEGVYRPTKTSRDDFSWSCEEISFATLEREWGDIVVHEYLGQKLVLLWNMGDADTIHGTKLGGGMERFLSETSTTISPTSTTTTTTTPQSITILGGLRLDATPMTGTKVWRVPLIQFQLNVIQSQAIQVDDVTVLYKGLVRLKEIRMDFCCLVRAYARNLEPVLRNQFQQIEETRPLLDHEHAFFRQVSQIASLGT